jgi:hypothetical protein
MTVYTISKIEGLLRWPPIYVHDLHDSRAVGLSHAG